MNTEILIDLVQAQVEYIEFLEKNINYNAGYLYVHGMNPSQQDVDEGIRLRKLINDIKNALEP